jgi:hypothetical protein
MAGVIENYSKFEVSVVVRFLQVEGMIESEIHCRLVSVHGQNIIIQMEPCGATNLKTAKCQWMMIHRSKEADQQPCTLVKIEDKNILQKTVGQYFTFHAKERYCERMCTLVKRWDKCLHANMTVWKHKHYDVMFLDFTKDIFCNKYVNLIWRCTFKLGPPIFWRKVVLSPSGQKCKPCKENGSLT